MVSHLDPGFCRAKMPSTLAPVGWIWGEEPCTTRPEEHTAQAIRAWCILGDQRAAHWLVHAYRPLVRSIMNRLSSPSLVDDAEQETLIRAFGSLHRYDVSQPFSAWISTIARNVLLNTFRNHRRYEIHLDRDAKDQVESKPGGRRPDESLEAREHLESVMICLDDLASNSSRIFRRHVFEGLSPDEISETEGVSAGAVRISVHRTRIRLRERLEFLS